MRGPSEMVTAPLMHNMVQLREKNAYFVTNSLSLFLLKSSLGALGVESPTRWVHTTCFSKKCEPFVGGTCSNKAQILDWMLDVKLDTLGTPWRGAAYFGHGKRWV